MTEKKKILLVVSFGTSYEDTRKKTIDVIERDMAECMPKWEVRRAWTSGMIIEKIKKRDHYLVDSVKEAMKKIAEEKPSALLVQPTHIVNGIENDRMKEEIIRLLPEGVKLSFGNPLLTTDEDSDEVIDGLMKVYDSCPEDTALVYMGHGTTHYANTVYAALDYKFKDRGYKHVFVGTVEAYPSMQSLLRQIKEGGYRKVWLAPFMVVAGDHAANDMSGSDPDSWRNRFEREGFEVTCIMKGLGEYSCIRRQFLEHADRAQKELS